MMFFMKCEHDTMSLTVFRGISKKRWDGRHYRELLVGRTVACVVPMVFLFSRCCFHFCGDQINGFSKQCNSRADVVISLNSSLSTHTQTTFSVDNIS